MKIVIVITLAFAVGPFVSGNDPIAPEGLGQLGGWAVHEAVIGGMIGFAFSILFWAIRMAGDLIGLQMGFSIVNVIDPNSTGQVSLIGEFKYVIAMLILLLTNGHHLMITALIDSYRVIPVGGGVFGFGVYDGLLRLSATAFVTAVKIGAPAMITLLLTDVALGILARTVPQMNIFIVGFPLKIGVGLFVLGLSLPLLMKLFSRTLQEINVSTQKIIAAMVVH